MDLDDLEPRRPKDHALGTDLTQMSVAELRELLERLRAEIARVEAALEAKEASRSAAQSVFKS